MTNAPALSADPLDILLKHNHWSTAQLIGNCAALSSEQFHKRFEMGLGSLHDNLTHTVGAMLRWADRIAQRELKPSIEATWPADVLHTPPVLSPEGKPRYTPQQLGTLLRLATKALQDVAAEARASGNSTTGGLATEFTTTMVDGTTYRFTKAGALVHVTTHGMHHRAQCLNMLRHIGDPAVAGKLPPSAVMQWQARGEPAE